MSSIPPHEIRTLRDRLGWSAAEMGRFFDRTGATIYHWENGDSRPGATVQALMDALRTELARREHRHTSQEVSEWIEKLEDERIVGFLDELANRPEFQAETYRNLADEAEEHGGLLLRSNQNHPLAYVVPLTESGLVNYARRLLGVSAEEGGLSEAIAQIAQSLRGSDPATLTLEMSGNSD
jgi:transcriptional regulator with XRE-family HTH domain